MWAESKAAETYRGFVDGKLVKKDIHANDPDALKEYKELKAKYPERKLKKMAKEELDAEQLDV